MMVLEDLISAVRQAGEIVNGAKQIGRHTHKKTSAADLVTDYDLTVEAFLKEKLAGLLPEALFFGEEEELAGDEELVAVMAAAIAAAEEIPADGFVVRSIRRRRSNKWNRA